MSIDQEIEFRKPIWKALSDLYLDTELQDSDYTRLAEIFKASKFGVSELKDIDLYEVFPVLKGNLISVAGEWNGFDEQWLIDNCTEYYKKRNKSSIQRIIKLEYRFLSAPTKDHWKEIEQRM